MAVETNKASVSSIFVEDDVEPGVTRKRKVFLILDKLKAPSSTDLSRKRKLALKTAGENRRANAKVFDYEPTISAKERLEEIKDEPLTLEALSFGGGGEVERTPPRDP